MSDFKKSCNEEHCANKISATSSSKASAENTIQLIQQRKENIYKMENPQKYAMLAAYSACQDEVCKCIGWTALPEDAHHNIELEPSYFPEFNELCSSCGHDMQTHILHLLGISNAEMTELLSSVVDMENLLGTIMKVQDSETKMAYKYLVKCLRQSILLREQLFIHEFVGKPPFGSPCVATIISSFAVYKYSYLNVDQFNFMLKVCQTFLDCLNSFNLEIPSVYTAEVSPNDRAIYKVCYTRWLFYCQVPKFWSSFPQFRASSAFGGTFLRTVFPQLWKILKHNCIKERNNFSANEIEIHTQMPKFLEDLKAEILKNDSPIWDINYLPRNNKVFPLEYY